MITKEMFARIASEVKSLMLELNFKVNDIGLPNFEIIGDELFEGLNLNAAYTPENHTVYINKNTLDELTDESTLHELIAHELVHSFQGFDPSTEVINDVSNLNYWLQEFEQEAMSVGFLWNTIYGHVADLVVCQETKKTAKEYYSNFMKVNKPEEVRVYLTNIIYGLWKDRQTNAIGA